MDQENKKILVTIYRQFDGYLSGMGADLREGFGNIEIENGMTGDKEMGEAANGMGCLAAQIIASLKNCEGNVYIYHAGTSDVWEDYTYTIMPPDTKEGVGVGLRVKVTGYNDRPVYEGLLSEMPEEEKDEDDEETGD
jgi:hypothetical protein